MLHKLWCSSVLDGQLGIDGQLGRPSPAPLSALFPLYKTRATKRMPPAATTVTAADAVADAAIGDDDDAGSSPHRHPASWIPAWCSAHADGSPPNPPTRSDPNSAQVRVCSVVDTSDDPTGTRGVQLYVTVASGFVLAVPPSLSPLPPQIPAQASVAVDPESASSAAVCPYVWASTNTPTEGPFNATKAPRTAATSHAPRGRRPREEGQEDDDDGLDGRNFMGADVTMMTMFTEYAWTGRNEGGC